MLPGLGNLAAKSGRPKRCVCMAPSRLLRFAPRVNIHFVQLFYVEGNRYTEYILAES